MAVALNVLIPPRMQSRVSIPVQFESETTLLFAVGETLEQPLKWEQACASSG